MAFPNISDIATTTLEKRSKRIQDNVTNNNALLFQLRKKGRIQTVSGGRLIYEELSFQENSNGGWYSGYDTLPVAAQDVISAAEFNWKQYAVPVTVSGLEELQNSGEEALIDLMASRIDVAEATMSNDVEVGLYSDGTGSGGKTLTGLDAAVPADPTTGTYGGINRATYTFWRSQLADPASAPTSTTIQGVMTDLMIDCTRGVDKPDLIMFGDTLFSTYMASLQAIQRITDTDLANAGFLNVAFMGVPVVLGGGIGGAQGATNGFFLNTKYLKFRPHKDRFMVPIGKKRVSVNQDAAVEILGFAGNLTCSGSKFQGRLIGA
jgi:hypothetical protein